MRTRFQTLLSNASTSYRYAKGLVNPDLTKLPREEGGGSTVRKKVPGGGQGGAGAAGAARAAGDLSSGGGSGEAVSLKAVTDAAAAAGERLPSEGGGGGGGGGGGSGIFGRVFPSLGAAGAAPTPAERQRRASKRKATRQRLKVGLDLGGALHVKSS